MVEFHSVSDHTGLPDDDSGTMVDEEVGANRCTRMDVDSGAAVSPLGHHPGKERNVFLVEQMGDALDGDCFESRVSQNDLLETPRRRITRVGGLYVSFEEGAY